MKKTFSIYSLDKYNGRQFKNESRLILYIILILLSLKAFFKLRVLQFENIFLRTKKFVCFSFAKKSPEIRGYNYCVKGKNKSGKEKELKSSCVLKKLIMN